MSFNPFRSVGALTTLIDFTLSNARRFYSSMGNPSDMKGLRTTILFSLCSKHMQELSVKSANQFVELLSVKCSIQTSKCLLGSQRAHFNFTEPTQFSTFFLFFYYCFYHNKYQMQLNPSLLIPKAFKTKDNILLMDFDTALYAHS